MKLRQRLMNHILLSQQKRDVLQDVVIWERKRYQTPPRLCRADGPIGKYRRYCQQFYAEQPISQENGTREGLPLLVEVFQGWVPHGRYIITRTNLFRFIQGKRRTWHCGAHTLINS